MGQTLVLPHFNSMVFPLGYDERVHPALNVSLTEARQPHTRTHTQICAASVEATQRSVVPLHAQSYPRRKGVWFLHG